jgi:hypothetical protein
MGLTKRSALSFSVKGYGWMADLPVLKRFFLPHS